MQSEEITVPDEVRDFAWAFLQIHRDKLARISRRVEEQGRPMKSLEMVLRYLNALMEDGPEDSSFVDWCAEALEAGVPEPPPTRVLRVLPGGKS